MKVALVGYGKMGKAIEKIALDRGHEVVLRVGSSNREEMTQIRPEDVDVVIEFTNPEAARANVLSVLDAGVPVVCGSTGWTESLEEAQARAKAKHTAFLFASNFSVGVNLFFEINKALARLMNGRDSYAVSVEETHHIHKKDLPGGTAITIAEQIVDGIAGKSGWKLAANAGPADVPITAHRVGEVPGTHIVSYASDIDTIEIKHTAHNRTGFAFGAVLAAEFLCGRQGVYSMKDVLGIPAITIG